jgi:hypothetical protein
MTEQVTSSDKTGFNKRKLTVISAQKLVSGEYALKEADKRMLKEMKCEFIVRITDTSTILEVILPANPFVRKDRPNVIPYYDFKAALGYLGALSAKSFGETKTSESAQIRAALCALLVSGIGTKLDATNISEFKNVKAIGLYILKAALIVTYISKLKASESNKSQNKELLTLIRDYLCQIPSIIQERIEEKGLGKISPDAPCGKRIPAWLHGKIGAFPMPKDLEDVPCDLDEERFLFGKTWTSGFYLMHHELDLAKAPGLETLCDLQELIQDVLQIVPNDGASAALIDGKPNFQHKQVKALLEKRKFHLPPREYVWFEPTRSEKPQTADVIGAALQTALSAPLKLRAGVIDYSYSLQPTRSERCPHMSIELMLDPDYLTSLGSGLDGKQQQEFKKVWKKAVFPHLSALGFGKTSILSRTSVGWSIGESRPAKMIDTLSAIIGFPLTKQETKPSESSDGKKDEVKPDPEVASASTETRTPGLCGTGSRVFTETVKPPLLPKVAKMVIVTESEKPAVPPSNGEIKTLPKEQECTIEAQRIKNLYKEKDDKPSSTTQVFLGLLVHHNPYMTQESLSLIEKEGTVPSSNEAMLCAAKLFSQARVVADSKLRAKFQDPDSGSESEDGYNPLIRY